MQNLELIITRSIDFLWIAFMQIYMDSCLNFSKFQFGKLGMTRCGAEVYHVHLNLHC